MITLKIESEHDINTFGKILGTAEVCLQEDSEVQEMIKRFQSEIDPESERKTLWQRLLDAKVDGWLTEKEAVFLFYLAKLNYLGSIVEIGAWKGFSTIILALGSIAGMGRAVFSVDPHTGSPEHGTVWTYPEFKKNLETFNVSDIVLPMVSKSEDVPIGRLPTIGLLYIDGDHSYENVKQDFEKFYPKVSVGGYILFHDSTEKEGVVKLINEIKSSGKYPELKLYESISYMVKK